MDGFGIKPNSRLQRWTQPEESSGEDLDRLKWFEEYCMEDVYYKEAQRNVRNIQNEKDYFKGSPEEKVKLEKELKEASADFREKKAKRVKDERRFKIEPKACSKVVKKKVTFSHDVKSESLRKSTRTFRPAKKVPNLYIWSD